MQCNRTGKKVSWKESKYLFSCICIEWIQLLVLLVKASGESSSQFFVSFGAKLAAKKTPGRVPESHQ